MMASVEVLDGEYFIDIKLSDEDFLKLKNHACLHSVIKVGGNPIEVGVFYENYAEEPDFRTFFDEE